MVMTEPDEFEQRLLHSLMRDCFEFQRNNTDYLRFRISPAERFKTRLRDWYFLFARRNGFSRRHFSIEEASQRLSFIFKNIDGLRSFNNLLTDDDSRQLLIDLLKFRTLGAKHVRLPLNTKQYWESYRTVDKRFLRKRDTVSISKDWHLNQYELEGTQGPVRLHVTPLGILNSFLLEQYAYRKGGRVIEAEPGEVVIDGGGCTGDTALYFADRVGGAGMVYCFEFDPDNLAVLEQNLDLNPSLKDRIKVVRNALWDESGEVIEYSANGPGTSLFGSGGETDRQASTLNIDDLVKAEKLEKVDFIKMDIEGAELKALRGAEQTLRAFRPKLAISLYHKDDDFILIPDYLNKLDLGYEFFLDHFTIHREETVLFGDPKRR
jgi:FkbM family methyltransferase